MKLTLEEERALLGFLAEPTPLKSALEKFLDQQAERTREMCASCMASVPRRAESASDYAAKAEAYSSLMAELIEQARRL